MIKTVKVEKKLRLDELIKYVWDNDIQNRRFRSNESDVLVLVEHGRVLTEWTIEKCETFTVEVEEKIDYDTIFEEVYRVTKEGYVTSDKNKSINECLDWKDYQTQIFAMIDRKLELIWEDK